MPRTTKIVIGLISVIGIVLAYWLISPLFIDKKVSEGIDEIQFLNSNDAIVPEIISEGLFVDADSFHKSKGSAKLMKLGEKYFVRFEDNFETTNGPDLFVYFGKDGFYIDNARIGELKGNIGSQNYEVPENINPLDYTEVWIWCRAFSVPFGHAKLQAI